MMNLVERHIIDRNDPRWSIIDDAAFLSKNLYNAANYLIRQQFFDTHKRLRLKDLYHQVRAKYPQDYEALPRKVSNQVLKLILCDWQSYFDAYFAWRKAPQEFTGEPGIPHYKHKTKGRATLIYERGAISKKSWLRDSVAKPSGLDVKVKTSVPYDSVREIRIVPRHSCYIVEIIYQKEEAPPIDSPYVAGLDIGLNNLAAVASNKPGLAPLLVNGRPLKAINQFYNKRKAQLQSKLPDGVKSSRRIRALIHKRNLKIDDYLHKSSRMVIDWCVEHQIATLVIGKNDGWKQRTKMGKRNNQNFNQIPFTRFIEMLQYKGKLAGIDVRLTEESYTSKCSFLDMESIEKHEQYAGKRVKRGLFQAHDGQYINADINAALNMVKKVVPNAFADGIEGVAVRPVWLVPDEAEKS